MNRWHLEEDKKEYFLSLVKPFMGYLENLTEEMFDEIWQDEEQDKLYLHLSDSGINPWQLKLILEKLGYEETEQDCNGWDMCIEACGMTFSLSLSHAEV